MDQCLDIARAEAERAADAEQFHDGQPAKVRPLVERRGL
jgi:hypothetical protein